MPAADPQTALCEISADPEFRAILKFASNRHRKAVAWRHGVAVASSSKLICKLPDSSTIFLCGSTNSGFALEQSDVDLMVVVDSESISGIAEHRTEMAGNIIVSVRTVMLTTNNILSLADLCRLSESCCLAGSRPRLSADIVDH